LCNGGSCCAVWETQEKEALIISIATSILESNPIHKHRFVELLVPENKGSRKKGKVARRRKKMGGGFAHTPESFVKEELGKLCATYRGVMGKSIDCLEREKKVVIEMFRQIVGGNVE
jgi:hypothetical protein